MNLEQLRNQEKSLEQEMEGAKASFYRAEGALAIVKHQIVEAEKVADTKVEKPKKVS